MSKQLSLAFTNVGWHTVLISYMAFNRNEKGLKKGRRFALVFRTDHFPPVTQNLSHSKMLNPLRLLAALNVGDKRFFQDNIQSPF